MVQIKRNKILETLGLSEDDIVTSTMLFKQMGISSRPSSNQGRSREFLKEEKVLGYTTTCLQREKALKILGTTEEGLKEENCKSLGALGKSGRRRSFTL